MKEKKLIRERYQKIRNLKHFEIGKNFFKPLVRILKKKFKNKKINLSLYYPSSNELNLLPILEMDFFKKTNFLLPVLEKKNTMNFFKWEKNDPLFINKYGILEPCRSVIEIPDVLLAPIVAFDKKKNRLGYGKGFYDRYLDRYNKKNKKIITIGIAFSFQRYHKLPINKKDIKLDYILTDKGIF